ncbi:DUF4190 domain-containing protein [Streptomyces sp. NPDC051636]|uniref:DUF4190 domain-containing protein n=1 Tax=Streptomyces sp. NPDC051636 TaxID=3365663 RepID=UPI00378D2216
MSDEVRRGNGHEDPAPDPWPPPAGQVPGDHAPADRIPGDPAPSPWVSPAAHTAPGPGDTIVSGAAGTPAPPSVHDERTLTSFPDAPAPPAWANPFAAPSRTTAQSPPPNPFAPPTAAAPQPRYATVPPPPIAPDGPGQVPYGYPAQQGYGWPGMQPVPSNGMGTAGLVLGILAAICFCLWPLAIVLGVLAVIFGAVGRGKARRGEATNAGQALAGVICGAAGIVLGLVVVAFLIATG